MKPRSITSEEPGISVRAPATRPPVQDSAVAIVSRRLRQRSSSERASAVVELAIAVPRQTDGGARGGRNAFLAAGETELLAGRRLHGDARNIDGGNFGDACAHLVTPGADLRALADQ